MLIGIDAIGYLPIGVDGPILTLQYAESNNGVLTLSATGPHVYSPIYQNWTAVEDNYNFSIDWLSSESVVYNLVETTGNVTISSIDAYSSTLTSVEDVGFTLNATQIYNISLVSNLAGELIFNSSTSMFPVVGELATGVLEIGATSFVAPYLTALQSTVDTQTGVLYISGETSVTLALNTGGALTEIPQIWIG